MSINVGTKQIQIKFNCILLVKILKTLIISAKSNSGNSILTVKLPMFFLSAQDALLALSSIVHLTASSKYPICILYLSGGWSAGDKK